MKRAVLGLGIASVLAMMPIAASAAVKLNIEDKRDLIPVTAGTQFVDLVFETTGENETTINENLAFYDIGVRLVKVRGGAGGGVQFVSPFVGKPDNFVFPDNAEIAVVDETTPTFAFANIDANSSSNFDITTGKKAARLYFQVDPLTALDAVYELRFDRDYTTISAGAGDDPNIVTDLSDLGQISFIPEPGSLSLLAIGGLLALRRRRTA
jgi:hypothetical protein